MSLRLHQTGKLIARLTLAAVLSFCTRELRLAPFDAALKAERHEDLYLVPQQDVLPVLSLGYSAALADLLWSKSLVYFGDGVANRSELRHVFAFTDAVLALDASFRAPYRWIATAAMSRPTQELVPDGLRAASYLDRALERWPEDGALHWELGSLLRFDIAPHIAKGPEKDRVLVMAAEHISQAAARGAGPPWLVLNNASLFERLGQKEQALHHLEIAFATVDDDELRTEMAARMARLRAEISADKSAAGLPTTQSDPRDE